jgi:hypothetical protein
MRDDDNGMCWGFGNPILKEKFYIDLQNILIIRSDYYQDKTTDSIAAIVSLDEQPSLRY